MERDKKYAVLIDADNIPASYLKGLFQEIAKYGTPTFKRIYGDWTQPNLKSWKTVLLENAITPVQQYSYTKGKNATDSAMIIDAMDILYSGKVDGFCLVSSDSDFTRLATRLREAGMQVIGMGEKKTPEPFMVACDKFIYLEIINEEEDIEPAKTGAPFKKKKETVSKVDQQLIRLLEATINDIADDNGWAYLGEVGNLLMKKRPNFDARNYGFNKLTALFRSLKHFEIDEREDNKTKTKLIYVRANQN